MSCVNFGMIVNLTQATFYLGKIKGSRTVGDKTDNTTFRQRQVVVKGIN